MVTIMPGETAHDAALRSLRTLVHDREWIDHSINVTALEARAEGATLAEVGDALGITPSGALQMLRRAELATGDDL